MWTFRHGLRRGSLTNSPEKLVLTPARHTQVTSDPQPILTDPETESIRYVSSFPPFLSRDWQTETISLNRSSIEELLTPYVRNHYHEGTCAVYTLEDPNYPQIEEEEIAGLEDEAVVEESKKEVVVEQEEKKISLVDTEGIVDEAEEKKDDEMEVEPTDVVEEPKDFPKSEHEIEEKSTTEEVVPEAPEEKEVSLSIPEKEETTSEVEATPTPAHRPLPALRSRIFELYLVGNKYNPTNFWWVFLSSLSWFRDSFDVLIFLRSGMNFWWMIRSGRWKSVYKADYAAGVLTGEVKITCHYYEQGELNSRRFFSWIPKLRLYFWLNRKRPTLHHPPHHLSPHFNLNSNLHNSVHQILRTSRPSQSIGKLFADEWRELQGIEEGFTEDEK